MGQHTPTPVLSKLVLLYEWSWCIPIARGGDRGGGHVIIQEGRKPIGDNPMPDSVLWAHVKNQTEGSPGRLPKALEEDALPHLQFEANQWLWGWGWGKKHPFPGLFSCKAGEMCMHQQYIVEALWVRDLYAGHTDVAVWAWRRSEVNWQHAWWKGQGTEPLDRLFPSDYGKFAFILKPYLFFW